MATAEPASVRRSLAAPLFALFAASLLTACPRGNPGAEAAPQPPAAADERRVLYYYDPMRPEVHFEKPGPSPFMDMALVPKYAETHVAEGVAVSSSTVQSLGIRTAHPARKSVRPEVRVPARVVADPRGQARVQSRVEGWVERLYVRALGERVAAGERIADIHSPQLVQAQAELFLGADAAAAAVERLRRLGIADVDIQAVQRRGEAMRRVPLRAPISGVVTALGVAEGSRVSQETAIVDLVPREARWIEAQLLPAQKLLVGTASSAHFSMPGVAGFHWESGAGEWLPAVDAVTQAIIARFRVGGAEDLPFGAVLDARVSGGLREDVLLVPTEAVIRTAQGDRVIRNTADGRFVPVPVTVGQRYGSDTEILQGVTEADRIVSSGQFLLDAEASLQAGLDRMGSEGATGHGAP